ncbi:MAG: phosphatidylglycerophosphatase A [Acidobacteriia bacterium]|nr:phosphatidylglycerophosphatase A [Terriglobia bacterium]
MSAGAGPHSADGPTPPDSGAARPPAAAGKPRFALFIATACGLGYLPKAPGTWGSLAAIPIYFVVYSYYYFGSFPTDFFPNAHDYAMRAAWAASAAAVISVLLAGVGVQAASRAAEFSGKKDPQFVVIDEVSGQHLTLILGSVLPVPWSAAQTHWPGYPFGSVWPHSVLSWQYLLLGLILFRVFDIWKPFPARQAESLPGGWGIMADDWVAGVYAAIGLWIARAAGL